MVYLAISIVIVALAFLYEKKNFSLPVYLLILSLFDCNIQRSKQMLYLMISISKRFLSNIIKFNVLVYSDSSTIPSSVKHTVETLRDFLEYHYGVSTIYVKALEMEPRIGKTSALVFRGGTTLPYVKECKSITLKII